MTRLSPFKSLRIKIILAAVVVQVILALALATNSVDSIEQRLVQLAELRVSEVEHLLSTALAGPLVERNYGELDKILRDSRSLGGIQYLAVLDDENQMVAASGWDAGQPLPPPEKRFRQEASSGDGRFDGALPIQLAGLTYGTLRFGIPTGFIEQARSQLWRDSMILTAALIVLSGIGVTLLSLWLTRHLSELAAASQAVAEGRVDVRLPVRSGDEVGQLTHNFNAMAEAIRQRIDQLSASEEKFHAIADYTHGWESWFGPQQQLVWVNPSVERLTGYTVDQCHNMADFPFPLILEDDRAAVREHLQQAVAGQTGSTEFRVQRQDHTWFWAAAAWQPIFSTDGQFLGTRASIRDVTDQKDAETALQNTIRELQQSEDIQRRLLAMSHQEQARMTSLLAAMKMGVLFETADNSIAYYNPSFLDIWNIDGAAPLTGRPTTDVLRLSRNVLAVTEGSPMPAILQTHSSEETVEINLADGKVVTQTHHPVNDSEGRLLGHLWVFEDVTRERQTAEQLIYLAERDSLTGLFNRRRFQQELGRVLDDAMRRDAEGALLFFDLDEFKYINDTFGHRAGDTMLVRVASEVSALVRRNEILSRLGGDEFAVLMPDAGAADAKTLAERITRGIAQIPFQFQGENLRLTTSIGIALYPQHGAGQEELIAHADAAMYQAKEAGKNAWRVYRHDLDTSREMVNRMSWNDRIVDALENQHLRLHFQGVYHTADRRLSHIEALVRMIDRDDPDAVIMPNSFIPFAEKTGRIVDIDRWVIREAVTLLAEDPTFPPLAVNISGRSFDDPSLPLFIADQLAEWEVEPQRLMVELTETSAVTDLHDARRFIQSLQEIGCQVCLDDFGAGFSSFIYLKHLNADLLKIDGEFIRNLPQDQDNQIFVKAIAEVAQGMQKITVAEFVEDEATLAMVRSFGLDLAQGYHLHRPSATPPLPAADARSPAQ